MRNERVSNDEGGTIITYTTNSVARVTAVHRGRYALLCEQGEIYAKLKPGVYYNQEQLFPTVGDFVMIRYNETGDSQIIRTLERKTYFARKEASTVPQEQAVAANFDYVFIMQSMNHNFNVRRLERYLALAWQSRATPVILLTKADLVADPTSYVEEAASVAQGVDICVVSAHTGAGMDTLRAYLRPGITVVFLGSSGIGKSSLVNALAGEMRMSTGAIREEDSRGRHTTSFRQLIRLPSGAMVIDTPGMRELGMWDAEQGIEASFSDVEDLIRRCRFSDCHHESEPGCRIREALASGELSRSRWENYQKLQKESRRTAKKKGKR